MTIFFIDFILFSLSSLVRFFLADLIGREDLASMFGLNLFEGAKTADSYQVRELKSAGVFSVCTNLSCGGLEFDEDLF